MVKTVMMMTTVTAMVAMVTIMSMTVTAPILMRWQCSDCGGDGGHRGDCGSGDGGMAMVTLGAGDSLGAVDGDCGLLRVVLGAATAVSVSRASYTAA